MKIEESEKLLCPYINANCINTKCMMWVDTSSLIEIHRFIMPYGIRFTEEGKTKHIELISRGYKIFDGDVYIKNETECVQGYCSLKKESLK